MTGITAHMSMEPTKELAEYHERIEPVVASHAASTLSPEHQAYLMERHGTLDLDPMPGFGRADPYNWPHHKKVINIVLVAIHASMSTFIAAAIIPAFADIAIDLNVSLQEVSYLVTLQIAILAIAPLVWKPFSNTYGRRPLFLLSLVGSLAGNIGCAKSSSYATMAFCRAIAAFFISPAAAIGSAIVTEVFFKKDRARYVGIWTLMTILGVPIASLVMGFVATAVGYRWIYWIITITNGVQLITYFFFGPETRYIRSISQLEESNFIPGYCTFGRIDPNPLRFWDFVHPLGLWRKVCVVLPAIAASMTFMFGNTLIAVEIPALFGEKFNFNAQQLGLQFIGMIVGSVIGEQFGGSFSDYWMRKRAKKTEIRKQPEYRLWLSYVGLIFTIVGLVVFLVQTQLALKGHWNITPVIGIAIASAGNQIVATILVTYALDCHPEESDSVGVFFTFVRQTWAFIGPFWFPSMFTNVGVAASSGVAAALIVGVGMFPTILLQCFGNKWRLKEVGISDFDSEKAASG